MGLTRDLVATSVTLSFLDDALLFSEQDALSVSFCV